MLDQLLQAVPLLFGAGLLLLLAYFVGRLVSGLVATLLAGVGFDGVFERLGITGGEAAADEAGRKPSELVGLLVMVAVMLFATIEALRLLEFEQLAAIVSQFTVFAGDVLLGVVIFGVGFYLANLAAEAIRSSSTAQAGVLALFARAAILVLAGAMALRQAGLAEDIINLAFGLLLGAIAVAAAIAFGIGGRDLAARYLERWSGKLEKEGGSGQS